MEEESATTTAQPTSFSDYVTILEIFTQGQKAYPDLVFIQKVGKGDILEVTQKTMKNIPEAG